MGAQRPTETDLPDARPSRGKVVGVVLLGLAAAFVLLFVGRKIAQEPVVTPLAQLEDVEGRPKGPRTDPESLATIDARRGAQTPSFDLGEEPDLDSAKAPEPAPKPTASTPRLERAARLARAIPEHPIDAAQIRRVLSDNERDITSCYEDRRATNLKRRILLTLVVEPNGTVRRTRIRGVPRAIHAVADCIAVKARSWRFSPPGGRTAQQIDVPIVIVAGAS